VLGDGFNFNRYAHKISWQSAVGSWQLAVGSETQEDKLEKELQVGSRQGIAGAWFMVLCAWLNRRCLVTKD